MRAGKAKAKLSFQKRSDSDDGFGTITTGDFEHQFFEYAELTPRLGSEAVFQSRLAGQQPYTMRVRSNGNTRTVDATWRAVDSRDGYEYSIVAPPINISQKNDYLDILSVVGNGGQ